MTAAAGQAETASDRLARYVLTLKRQFTDVAQITPAELEALRPRPVLLDARSEKEFAVSHLPSAIRVQGDVLHQLAALGLEADAPIVVYCSVGYRSSVLAQKLQAAGFKNVRNLEGSIFAWANEGRPLVNAHGSTAGVHPFNLLWGRYLDRDKWRWKPAPGSRG
ncbi:MAG: rhodanese-like domain-containing protein [Verrucomicrobiia bacterium]